MKKARIIARYRTTKYGTQKIDESFVIERESDIQEIHRIINEILVDNLDEGNHEFHMYISVPQELN